MESVELKNVKLLNAFDFNFTVGNTYTFQKEKDVWFVIDDEGIRHDCERFADKILPYLQKVLKEEIEKGIGWD
jgi:hypothetical protein